MVTIKEIMEFLGTGGGNDMEITGVNALDKASETEMTFRSGSSATPTKSPLILTRFDFARAAWKFFPPPPPKLTISKSAIVHPTAFIGRNGFGVVQGIMLPHYAGVTIEADVNIGAYNTVDRGMFSDTLIMQNTKFDNLVHVGHNCKIGRNCIITAGVILSGSVTIGHDCYLGINCSIKDHVKLGNHVTVGMGAVVLHDVPDGKTVVGNPAKILQSPDLQAIDDSFPHIRVNAFE